MHFNFEEVMTVDLKIRGPFAARDDLLVIQIVEGALTGTGAYADKLSGKVKAPSGDALEIGPNGVFKRNVRLLAEMDDDSFLFMQYGGRTRPNETYIERVAKGKVVNGDESDLRFLDPRNSIVGLKAKGKAKKDTTGFVVNS